MMTKYSIFFLIVVMSLFGCSRSTSQVAKLNKLPSLRSLNALKATAGTVGQVIFVAGSAGGFFGFEAKCKSEENGGTIIKGSNGCWHRVVSTPGTTNVMWFGAMADGVTDDTQAIQAAINALDNDVGGTINIPAESKFYLSNLEFTQKVILNYTSQSDKSRDAGHTKAINEQYRFIANANKAGAVNEYVVAAPFHPGLILDVRKDFNGQRRFLRGSQSYDNPVRASSLVRDEGMNQLIQQYQVYPDASNKYSGWRMNLFMNSYTITGIGSSSFGNKVKIGDVVENDSKTAKGNVIVISKSEMTIQWLSGRFSKGDKLVINGQKSKSTASAVKYESQSFNGLTLSRKSGYMGVGLPNDNAIYPLTVGGRLGIQSSRLHGQYLPESYARPGIVFANSFENNQEQGVQVILETRKNDGRLLLTDRSERIKANLGAVILHTAFNMSGQESQSSFNVARVEKLGKGDYLIHLTEPCSSKDFQVGLSTSKPLEYAYVYAKEKDRVRIRVVKTGTDNLVDPSGVISVICTGGDL